MKMSWNKELRKLVIAFLILVGLFFGLANLSIWIYCRHVHAEYYNLLAVVMGSLSASSPESGEEAIVRMLNDAGNSRRGAVTLAQYGVIDKYESSLFPLVEERLCSLWLGVNLGCLILFSVCGLFFFLYLRKRQNRINCLQTYLEALERGHYCLAIEDNDDDELSGLRNEIYKLTVFLKEQAQRALEQKKSLADSVADISHQLKTPLASASVLIDDLMEGQMEEIQQKRFLQEAMRQITGMSWLVTTMLKLSRLEAGVVDLEKTRLSVRELIQEACERLTFMAEWKDICFETETVKQLYIWLDRNWTIEALTNLIKNAVEYSPVGGKVEVEAQENDIYTQITIRDHGTGISKEEREKLFCRFYRGKNAGKDSTGIGLSLSRKIVEAQGGRISVDSGEGRGTTFTLRFMKEA